MNPQIFRRGIVGALGFVLLVGMGWAILPQGENVYFRPPQPMVAMMLTRPPGWEWQDRPLGETEYMMKVVETKLQFDQAFFRVYCKGDLEIGVYVAYWKPGGMDPWLIALHTPDICWTGNGGKIVEHDNQRVLRASGGPALKPGHFRIFDWPQARQEVVFWHLYGGRPSGFPIADDARISAHWRELKLTLQNTLAGRVRKEQVFVRISTNRTMDEVVQSDLWPMLTKSLAPTGLLERPASQHESLAH